MTDFPPRDVYSLWLRLSTKPGGKKLFSALVATKAPYFATVLATVHRMEPGRVEVTAPLWFGVKNHIGTFHAIAACNVAELAMGMLAESSLPTTHKWIPSAMTANYHAVSSGSVAATATFAQDVDFSTITQPRNVPVAIEMTDAKNTLVASWEITINVRPAR